MADQDQIEISRKLAAQRQIDAAIGHLKNVEFECAITLAGAAEEMLPDIDKAGFFQALTYCGQEVRSVVRTPEGEEPDHWNRGLLRTRRERPYGGGASNNFEEIAPAHTAAPGARITPVPTKSIADWSESVREAD
jgi:hypothetical protein